MTDADARGYCDTLLMHFAARLTEWEDGFVRSVRERLRRGQPLSEKQATALDALMERCAQTYHGSRDE